MSRIAPPLILSEPEKARLREITSSSEACLELVKRAQFLLLVSDGQPNQIGADAVKIHKGTASRWRHAVLQTGLDAFLEEALDLGMMRRRSEVRRSQPKRGRGRPRKYAPVISPSVPSEQRAPSVEVNLRRMSTANVSEQLPQKLTWWLAGIYMAPPNFGLVLVKRSCPAALSPADEEALQADAFVSEEPPMTPPPLRIPIRLASAIFYNQSRLQRSVTPHYDPAGWLSFLGDIDRAWPSAVGFEVIIENASSYTYHNPDLKAWLAQQGERLRIVAAHGASDWARIVEEKILTLAEEMRAEALAECLQAAETLETSAVKTMNAPSPLQWIGRERLEAASAKQPTFEVVKAQGKVRVA